MRICNICKKEKNLSEFFSDSSRSKGRSYRCKDCERIWRREKRQRNIEIYKARDRRYLKNHRMEILSRRKTWYLKNKVKISAHLKVRNALFKGVLKRLPCDICGSEQVDAHHEDYSKPLEIRWLCRKHHMRHHSSVPKSPQLPSR